MAYQRIFWKDRIVVLDDNGNITNVNKSTFQFDKT